jgi:aspartate/tyrosine/aromatic aminotransferase
MTLTLTDAQFVAEALERLTVSDSRGAPIIILHASDEEGPAGVLLTVEHWAKILNLMPEGEHEPDSALTALVMAHDHLEGDG